MYRFISSCCGPFEFHVGAQHDNNYMNLEDNNSYDVDNKLIPYLNFDL